MRPLLRRLWAVITGQDHRRPPATAAELPQLLTYDEAADYLNMHRAQFEGRIPVLKLGRHVRLLRSDLDAYLNAELRRPGDDTESVRWKA